VGVLATAFRVQLRTTHRELDHMMVLITVPLFTVVFLLIVQHAGRGDLTGHAVLAPVLIALWAMALNVSGELVEDERWGGTLELAVAAPARYGTVLVGRILAVTTLSLLSFAETLVVAWLFGVRITIHHPGVFAATLAVTVVATAGTALIMSSVFVLARSARTFQNSLSYPFYVLGGVIVPVALLPDWLRPVTRVVFLSWSSDLLRDSVAPEPVEAAAARLGVIVVLGALGFVLGHRMLARILWKVRGSGELGVQ
jgi:ABC-2 type transport system permease protein